MAAIRYIGVRELAKNLGVSPKTLYEACKAGEVPGAFQVRNRWVINLTAYETVQLEAARDVARRLAGRPSEAPAAHS